ncbi:uncharacterized protein K02A2.6-like [Ornithodoros turicata]|uniref:uncharacterized protein K02A2.6-like n=1 Tax=Ornithodoros turicata TaxID=34597 RepID=UPI003139F10E
MRDKVATAIQKMVSEGILEPIAFSRWATPIVPVHKRDGTLRICGDYRCTVNTVSQPDKYPLPTATEMFAILANGAVFSKLDLAQAYLQLPVDEESSNLLTLNTPLGLFKVKRLPFGVSAAPGIFQRFIETLLRDIPGVAVYLDDIIITSRCVKEHDQRVQAVLERLQHSGLRLNGKKCLFAVPAMDFLGFKISAAGIRPCADKVKAIHGAREPRDKKELQAFLGLVNFYERFVANKATLPEPLHRPLDKNAKWK